MSTCGGYVLNGIIFVSFLYLNEGNCFLIFKTYFTSSFIFRNRSWRSFCPPASPSYGTNSLLSQFYHLHWRPGHLYNGQCPPLLSTRGDISRCHPLPHILHVAVLLSLWPLPLRPSVFIIGQSALRLLHLASYLVKWGLSRASNMAHSNIHLYTRIDVALGGICPSTCHLRHTSEESRYHRLAESDPTSARQGPLRSPHHCDHCAPKAARVALLHRPLHSLATEPQEALNTVDNLLWTDLGTAHKRPHSVHLCYKDYQILWWWAELSTHLVMTEYKYNL